MKPAHQKGRVCTLLLIEVLLLTTGISHAGSRLLARLLDSAGDFNPPFNSAGMVYSQTHRYPELLIWPQPDDPGALVEVRINGGSFQRLATGRTLAVGRYHVVLLRADGTVVAWGRNNEGQCQVPAGLNNIVSVAAGDGFSLALRADGTVAAWGAEAPVTAGPRTATGAVAIATDPHSSYVVRGDGTVQSWGAAPPVPAGLPPLVGLEAYAGTVRGFQAAGTVVAWSYQGISQTLVPTGFENVVSTAMEGRDLALRRDGTVVSWSNTQFGAEPWPVPAGLRDVVAIAADESMHMALRADGTVVCWNAGGVTPNPEGLLGVVAIDAGGTYRAALKSDGTVVVWGTLPEFVAPPPVAPGGATLCQGMALPLNPGSNTVDVRVTPGGTSGQPGTYVLEVHRVPNADLQLLEPDRGILSPAFSPGTADYTLHVPFANEVVRWRSTPDSPGAAVRLNGEAVVSGALSRPWPLAPGANVFTFSVMAEGGRTEKDYVVTVTRGAPQTNAALRHLAHMAGPLVPAFSPEQLAYTHAAPVRQPRLVLWPRVAEIGAKVEVRSNARPYLSVAPGPQAAAPGHPTVIQPDGMPVAWNSASTMLPLPAGTAALAAMSICQSADAAYLRTDGKAVPVSFSAYNLNHPAPVMPAGGLENIVEIAIGGWGLCTALRTDGTALTWYRSSGEIFPAFAGLNDIISVAAGRGYALALRRNGSVTGWGDWGWGPFTVPEGLSDVIAIAGGEGFAMALRRDGTVLSWGSGAQTIAPPGLRDVAAIYARSGQALALRANGTIARFGWPGGAPEFSDSLAGVRSLAGGANAIIAVKEDGVPVIWNYPAAVPPGITMRSAPTAPAVPLDIGANNVQVRVTAESGAVRTYTLAVTREVNVELQSLQLDFGTLSPAFSPAVFDYALAVPSARNSLTLTPLADDDTTEVRVGRDVVSRGASRTVSLKPGLNTVVIQMLAEDGVTVRTYTLSITRLGPNPNLSQLGITDGALTPAFVPGNLDFTRSLQLSSATVWPRQVAAGASLEVRTNGGAWSPLSTGQLIARGGPSAGPSFAVVVLPNGTVAMPDNGSFPPPAGLAGVVSVAAGNGHCLALKSDGTVVAWGNGNAPSALAVPPDVINVSAIAAAGNFNLAVMADGTVKGWGDNTGGVLNIPARLRDAVAVAAFGGPDPWSMVLRRTGEVVTWGAGQGLLPVPAEARGAVAISAGTSGTGAVALLDSGRIIQWTARTGVVAREYPALTGILAVGPNHVLRRDGTVLRLDGTELAPSQTGAVAALEGWYGVRADGSVVLIDQFSTTVTGWTVAPRPSFVHTALPHGQTTLEFRVQDGIVTDTHTVTLTREPHTSLRQLFTSAGSLQPAFSRSVSHYTQVQSGTGFTVWPAPVAAGAVVEVRGNGGPWKRISTTCLLGMEGNFFAGLTSGGTLQGLHGWTATRVFGQPVSATQGVYHDLALLDDGTPIGTSQSYASAPFLMPLRRGRYSSLEAGYHHAVGVLENGTLRLWGDPADGRLEPPPGLNGVVEAEAGGAHAVALRADGTVVAWGSNAHGQASVPTGLQSVVAVAAGGRHSLALRSNGTVVAWGDNSAGQTTVPPGLTGVVAIAAGDNHNIALKADSSLAAWGNNGAIPGGSLPAILGVVGVAAASGVSAAIRQDGSVQAWGTGSHNLPPPEFRTYTHPRAAVLHLQPGSNLVEIRVTEPGGSATSTTTVNVISGTALQVWKQTHFGTVQNSGPAADNADPDKDGLENLVEFAFARNPNAPDAASLPAWQIEDDEYVLNFSVPEGVSGVTYAAEYSATMAPGSWQPAMNALVPPHHAFYVPVLGHRLYVRLRVTAP